MDSGKAAKLQVTKKTSADSVKLQLCIDALGKKAEGQRRISAELTLKKVKLPADSMVPVERTWPLAALAEMQRLPSERSAPGTTTGLGQGESASKSKKARKKVEKVATNKGTNINQDSSRDKSGADHGKDRELTKKKAILDRELTRRKAILAAAAFEKWVAEMRLARYGNVVEKNTSRSK